MLETLGDFLVTTFTLASIHDASFMLTITASPFFKKFMPSLPGLVLPSLRAGVARNDVLLSPTLAYL